MTSIPRGWLKLDQGIIGYGDHLIQSHGRLEQPLGEGVRKLMIDTVFLQKRLKLLVSLIQGPDNFRKLLMNP